jgi:hypothetical protein
MRFAVKGGHPEEIVGPNANGDNSLAAHVPSGISAFYRLLAFE